MRAVKELKRYFKDNKLELDGEFLYDVSSKLDDFHKWEYPFIGFTEAISNCCCGVTELGEFECNKQVNKHWLALLEWYLRNTKDPFVICATLTLPEYKELNEALEKVGFNKRAVIRSKMGKKYKIICWDYIREKK